MCTVQMTYMFMSIGSLLPMCGQGLMCTVQIIYIFMSISSLCERVGVNVNGTDYLYIYM